MNEGKAFFDLPQADTVPAGSRYAVEMGDGSGTKSVTHEDVVQAVGEDLPLGDTEDLKTVEKNTFVAAINEIKDLTDKASGGALIRVYTTDPGLYGRIVSVTDGETVLTGSMSYTGECIISGVTINGSLTVSASTADDETDEATVDVISYATYHTALDTRQTYNRLEIITSDPGLIGKVVTITNGTDMVSTTISNDGRARSVFQFSGTITISASDDFGNMATSEVEMPDDSTGSYSVRLMLPGSISDAFLEKVAYKSGQYCIRDNALWVFTADKTAGTWDAGKVKKTTVTDALCELNGNFKTAAQVTLYDGAANEGDTITLSDSIYNYNFIFFRANSNANAIIAGVYNRVNGASLRGTSITAAGTRLSFQSVACEVSNSGKTLKIVNNNNYRTDTGAVTTGNNIVHIAGIK